MQNKKTFKEFIEELFRHYATVKPWEAGAADLEAMNKKVSDYLDKCENISEVMLLIASCGNNFVVNHATSFLTANDSAADKVLKEFKQYLESSDTSKYLLEKYDLSSGINSKDGQVLTQWQEEPISKVATKALFGLTQMFDGMPVKENHPIFKYINEYLIDSLIKLTESNDKSICIDAAMILGSVGLDKQKIKPALEKLAENDLEPWEQERVSYALKVLDKRS